MECVWEIGSHISTNPPQKKAHLTSFCIFLLEMSAGYSQPLITRAESLEVAEILGVTREVARAALNAAGGDPNQAIANLLTSATDPLNPPLTRLSRHPSDESVEQNQNEMENELSEFSGITRDMARQWLEEAGNDLVKAKENFIRVVLGEDAADPPEQRSALNIIKDGTVQGMCPICMEQWQEEVERYKQEQELKQCGEHEHEHAYTEVVRLQMCNHELCRTCLEQYIPMETSQGKVEILCPVPDCRLPLMQREVRAVIGVDAFSALDRRAVEIAVLADPTLHLCPSPDCTYVTGWAGPEDGPPRLQCPICQIERCLMCGRSYHAGSTCEEAKILADIAAGGAGANAAEEALTMAFLERTNVRRCARCGTGVVKSAGCNKMKCRCNYRFCYECGAENCIKDGVNCGCTPAGHGFIDNVTGRGDFNNLRSEKSPYDL